MYEDIENYEERLNGYSNEYYNDKYVVPVLESWLFYLSEYDLTKRNLLLKEPLKLFIECLYKKRIENLNLAYRTRDRLQREYEKQY